MPSPPRAAPRARQRPSSSGAAARCPSPGRGVQRGSVRAELRRRAERAQQRARERVERLSALSQRRAPVCRGDARVPPEPVRQRGEQRGGHARRAAVAHLRRRPVPHRRVVRLHRDARGGRGFAEHRQRAVGPRARRVLRLARLRGFVVQRAHAEQRGDELAVLEHRLALRRRDQGPDARRLGEEAQEQVVAPRLFVQVRLRRGPGAGGAGPVLGERVHQVARVGGERRARAPVLRQSAGGFEPEPRLRRRAAGAVGERRKLRAHARLRRRGGHRDGRGRGDRRPAIVPRLRVPRRRGRARRRGRRRVGARRRGSPRRRPRASARTRLRRTSSVSMSHRPCRAPPPRPARARLPRRGRASAAVGPARLPRRAPRRPRR